MNLARQNVETGATQLLFANFNQDNTSLAVGIKSGYKFFSLPSVDKLEQIYECTDTEDVCIVERLFSSSLVAIVSLKAPRKLKVCHFKKGTEICNYSYSNTILAVKLNRQRLIVCLEESLYIHNIRDMKVLHTIRETPPNPAGLCALSINGDNCYLAYPGSATIGEVQVFDTVNLRAANMIPAHNSPLAALAFDASGTKLATASEKGTVIRVFSIPEGQKLFELRRGMKRIQKIPRLLVAAADGYLYIYNLDPQEGGECTLMKQHKLDGSMEPANEILESASHDRPFVSKNYSAAATKDTYSTSPTSHAFSDELGAVGGTSLEDETHALRLDEDSENPPMVLRTE
ncbi:WD repeat domain phosphoinositide-interacting protein 2 isoform X3 [Ranitomeya variabilis]|uniref:WD repeat domain phosphoinositide-interacting protein 2 isoform X3 n=1 Tax=Ranitomeya variabilis TaxID=490064 RepID=UPI004057B076